MVKPAQSQVEKEGIMTPQDNVYAVWLNILGTDEIDDPDPDIMDDLHFMHDAAEASHRGTK
jgi:hypothetical protein